MYVYKSSAHVQQILPSNGLLKFMQIDSIVSKEYESKLAPKVAQCNFARFAFHKLRNNKRLVPKIGRKNNIFKTTFNHDLFSLTISTYYFLNEFCRKSTVLPILCLTFWKCETKLTLKNPAARIEIEIHIFRQHGFEYHSAYGIIKMIIYELAEIILIFSSCKKCIY